MRRVSEPVLRVPARRRRQKRGQLSFGSFIASRHPWNDGGGMNRSLIPRLFETVAEAADGGDHVGAELLADARDEHLDRVRIPVEILVVNMLDQLGAADHLALVVH